jgi:hypothetical protein
VGGGMMLSRFQSCALMFLMVLSGSAALADSQEQPTVGAAIPSVLPPGAKQGMASDSPSVAEKFFAAAPTFHGMLDGVQVQLRLRQKEDMREGLEGDYFVFGRSQKILLAGEFDRDGTIFLEESENGRNVSGQWDGKLDGDAFAGTWMSADGSVSKPFALKMIGAKPAAIGPALKKPVLKSAAGNTVK